MKRTMNSFRSFPPNCGDAPTPLEDRFDATNLKTNVVSESALGNYTTPFGNYSSNIKRSKVDLSGKIPDIHNLFTIGSNGRENEWSGKRKISMDPVRVENVVAAQLVVPSQSVSGMPISLHDKVYVGHKVANTSDNRVHEKDMVWNHKYMKIEEVILEAKGFINLLDSKDSKPKTFPMVDDIIKGSKESKDQLLALESYYLHPRTSIGEQKPMVETVKQDERKSDQICIKSGMYVVVEEEKALGTEAFSEDHADDFSNKDECTKPSMGKLEKNLESRSSLKFARECRNDIEPQRSNIVDFIDLISVGTKSYQPTKGFQDFELTGMKGIEDKCHVSTDLNEISTIAKREEDGPLKTFNVDDGIVSISSHKSPNATNSKKKLINWEIVKHDQPQGRKVMQILKLFEEEYTKILESGHKIRYPHIEAKDRVMAKEIDFSKDYKPFGHIPGIEIGDEFCFRAELFIVGLHWQLQAGIASVELHGIRYATSVVDSGGYVNTTTSDGTLIYSGQGGNPKVSLSDAKDQKLEKGNLALSNSMKGRYPVRVIYRKKMKSKSLSTKTKSNLVYVYDGLYMVVKYERKINIKTNKWVYKTDWIIMRMSNFLLVGSSLLAKNLGIIIIISTTVFVSRI